MGLNVLNSKVPIGYEIECGCQSYGHCRADEVSAIRYTGYVNSAVGFLHSADVTYTADVSKVHSDSTFTVDMRKVGKFLCIQL
jgi:hypothetical protein